MRLKLLRTFNTVKVAGKERSFFQAPECDITLDPNTSIITIVSGEDVTITSLSNMCWAKPEKKEINNEHTKSKESTTRAKKETESKKAKLGNTKLPKAKRISKR